MKLRRLLTSVVPFTIALAGCGSDDAAPNDALPTLGRGPGAFAKDFASSPDFTTRMSRRALGRPDVSPHAQVRIWYSSNLAPVLGRSSFPALPPGSVSIKEQDRDGDGNVDQLMVMVKGESGSGAGVGDWRWEQYAPNGDFVTSSVDDAGFRDFCSGCHADFPDTDWLGGTSVTN
jgi:hypothetical protein